MGGQTETIIKIVILSIIIVAAFSLVGIHLHSIGLSSIFNHYGPQMISVSVVIIGLIVFFAIMEFKLTPIKEAQVEKVVDIEAFNNIHEGGFCKSHEGDRNSLQKSCAKMTKGNCLATSCCVYAKMEGVKQCHSGDMNGPTFKRDDNGKSKNIDYYYYKNKCIGDGCKQ